MNNHKRIKENKHIKYVDKERVLCKSKLEQMEIANNSEANKFYQEVYIIRKGFKPQTD
jgi:hypothetical protein